MKLIGDGFFTGRADVDSTVKDAVLTKKRLAIDWIEFGENAHLDTTSADGIQFKGNYGYPKQDANYEFELTLFTNKNEYLLFGTYCEHDTGNEGLLIFRLRPKSPILTAMKLVTCCGRWPR